MAAAVAKSQSRRLQDKLALVWPTFAAAGRQLLGHPNPRDVYPEYLATFHGIVRASVPLMEVARDRARAMDGDPVAPGLVPYLEEHIPEEMHHDEWVLEDLEVLGIERSGVLAPPPSATVAELVGSQYYWILHYHPVALLGYMTLLEAYPPRQEDVEDLVARTGYPRTAFRTLLHHAEVDPHHSAELFDTIDALPLGPGHASVLGLSALSTMYHLTWVVREIVARVDRRAGRASP